MGEIESLSSQPGLESAIETEWGDLGKEDFVIDLNIHQTIAKINELFREE